MKASDNTAPEAIIIKETAETQSIRKFIASCQNKNQPRVLTLLKKWRDKNKQLNIFLPLLLVGDDNKSVTLLHYFAEKNFPEVLAYLLTLPCQDQEGQTIYHSQLINSRRETALHTAALNGGQACVALLLEHDFDSTALDIFGESTLTNAIYENHLEIAEMLFANAQQRLGDQVQGLLNAQDSIRGFTMLHHVVFEGHPRLARWLLERGADQNLQEPELKATPLMFALSYAFASEDFYQTLNRKPGEKYPSKKACLAMVPILLEYAQDIDLEARDNSGFNVVDFVYEINNDEAIALMGKLFPVYVEENRLRLMGLRERTKVTDTLLEGFHAKPELPVKAVKPTNEKNIKIIMLAREYNETRLLIVLSQICYRESIYANELQALAILLDKIDDDAYLLLLESLFDLYKHFYRELKSEKMSHVCLEIIKAVLQYDVTSQLINSVDSKGILLIVKAAESNSTDLMEAIITHGASLNARAKHGISILGQLVARYPICTDVFSYILKITPDVFSQVSVAGENFAHQVVRSYQPGVLDLISLLPDYDKALMLKNTQDQTPAQLSASLLVLNIHRLVTQSNLESLGRIYAQADCLLQFNIEPVFQDVIAHLVRMLKDPVYQAAHEKLRTEIVFICTGYTVDLTDFEIGHQMALHYLLGHGEVEVIKQLLLSGAAPASYFNQTLVYACDQNDLILLSWVLIEQKYALEQYPEILTHVFQFLACSKELLAAVVRDRVLKYAHLVNDIDEAGDNALMRAFKRDDYALVGKLVDNAQYNLIHLNAHNETILHMVFDHLVALKSKLSKNKKIRRKQQLKIKSLLQLFRRLCARHADLITIPKDEKMLLHSICEIGDLELLEIGDHDWYAKYNQKSCLDIAYECNQISIVDSIFSHAQALFRQKNASGMTMIQAAIADEKLEWVRRLMSLEPNFCDLLARDGCSTWDIARENNNKEIYQLLPKEPMFDTIKFKVMPAPQPVDKEFVKHVVVKPALKTEVNTYPEPKVATLFKPVAPTTVMLQYFGATYFVNPNHLQPGLPLVPLQNWQTLPFMHYIFQLQSGRQLALVACPTQDGLVFVLFTPGLTQQLMLPVRHHMLDDVNLVGFLEIDNQFVPIPKDLSQWQIVIQYPQGMVSMQVREHMREQQQIQHYQQQLFQAQQMAALGQTQVFMEEGLNPQLLNCNTYPLR